ncbi:bric a brac 2 [Carabus blaptoides fortunei]
MNVPYEQTDTQDERTSHRAREFARALPNTPSMFVDKISFSMEEKSSTNMSNGQQQFNLRWNNHTNNIVQVFTEQFTSETMVDVTLSCEGHFIKAHKMILSACSPYFQDLFRMHNATHPVVIINGMKYTDVKQVIDFMYRGEVKVLEAELDSLLAVAESLQVKGLSTVRNNYEKNDNTQTSNSDQVNHNSAETTNADTVHSVPGRQAKKRKISNDGDTYTKSEVLSDDESLSSTIKIEPPEIKDIDQEDEKLSDQEETVYEPKPQAKPAIKTSKSGRPIRQKTYSNSDTYTTNTRQPKYSASAVLEPIKACKIPRPPNAFMIFANEWRRKLASEHPKESNKEISVRLGMMWKNLSSDTKENYYSASRKADEEHKRKYPGYYYSPKEARLRKNLKESLAPGKKKNCDAMRFVKLVMKENSDNERWRTVEQTDDRDDDSFIEEETITEDVTVNTSDDVDNDDKMDALKIDTSPDENEADSSTSKD